MPTVVLAFLLRRQSSGVAMEEKTHEKVIICEQAELRLMLQANEGK